MTLFIALMLTAAFLGMFERTRDGLLWGIGLVTVLFALSIAFPESVLAAAVQFLLPFSLRP